MYVYVCMYVRMCVYTYVCMYVRVCVCTYVCVFTYVCLYVRIYVSTYLRIYVSTYLRIYDLRIYVCSNGFPRLCVIYMNCVSLFRSDEKFKKLTLQM